MKDKKSRHAAMYAGLVRVVDDMPPKSRADIAGLSDLVHTLRLLAHLNAAETLGRYLETGGNMSRTARGLHVSTRTARRRIRAIESHSGLDLGNGVDMLVAALTLLASRNPEEPEQV